MPQCSASEMTDAFIAVMLQDLEMTTNEESDDGAEPVDLDRDDLDPAALQWIAGKCKEFYIANEEHIHAPDACKRGAEYPVVSYAGSDLYMTWVGHGVGFWDSTCWDETHGGAMDEFVKTMGHFEGGYIGDDGKVYI